MTATRAVTHEVPVLAEGLGTFAQRLQELLRRELLSAECTITQARTLATLKTEGPKRLTDLAAVHQVTQPSMSILVARMEHRGLVERLAEAGSRRPTRIAITNTGRALLDSLVALRNHLIHSRLEQLTAGELEALSKALPALERLVEPQGDEVAG